MKLFAFAIRSLAIGCNSATHLTSLVQLRVSAIVARPDNSSRLIVSYFLLENFNSSRSHSCGTILDNDFCSGQSLVFSNTKLTE